MRHAHTAVKTDGDMAVTVKDTEDGTMHTVHVKAEDYARWMAGAHVQNAFPYLNKDDREILITGIGPVAWKRIFGSGEDD